MDFSDFHYAGALGGVIGVGWLVVASTYRGWSRINKKMSERVLRSIRMVDECKKPFAKPAPPSNLPASEHCSLR